MKTEGTVEDYESSHLVVRQKLRAKNSLLSTVILVVEKYLGSEARYVFDRDQGDLGIRHHRLELVVLADLLLVEF